MTDSHPSHAMTGPHGSNDDHGGTHGHDDHAHAAESEVLGPVDVVAWGAAGLGIAAGLAVAAALALSTGILG